MIALLRYQIQDYKQLSLAMAVVDRLGGQNPSFHNPLLSSNFVSTAEVRARASNSTPLAPAMQALDEDVNLFSMYTRESCS